MSNIYNKTFHHPNGTLIANWLEEEEMRSKTGEGRALLKRNFPKKYLDLNDPNPPVNPNPADDTFQRLIGPHPIAYGTVYSTYGHFKHPEDKYMHDCPRQIEFNNFIDREIQSKSEASRTEEQRKQNLRLFQTTHGNHHVAQPEVANLGRREMFTTNQIEVPEDRPDKLFMASHKMNKFPRAISNKEAEQYIDKNIPYTKDKEITFWSSNLNKGNMYHTHSLGINPFGRSNGFTQDVQHTRGATQFVGNNHNSSSSKNIYLNEHEVKYYDELQTNLSKTKEVKDLIPQITHKVMLFCQSRGWLGMRKTKIFLRNLFKRKSDLIDKTDLQYNLHQYGLSLQDDELNFIYLKYDRLKCNKINFIEFLDSLHSMSASRKSIVMSFIEEINQTDDKFISLKKLLRLSNFNYHPEVIRYALTSKQAVTDYEQAWDNLREDDFITKEHFIKFFEDVSCSIESDDSFSQCISSLYKNK